MFGWFRRIERTQNTLIELVKQDISQGRANTMAVQDDLKNLADQIAALVPQIVAAIGSGVSPTVLQPVADSLKSSVDAITAVLPK